MSELNFPYYFYPNIPLCGYMNTLEYNKNLVKLHTLIKELQNIDKKILLHLSIGAPAEEIISENVGYANSAQWIQLFPQHLHQAIYDGIEVVHIIIAPNKKLSSDPTYYQYSDPSFVRNTPELKWEINNYVYVSTVRPITVYVFYTMMPTIDCRNESIIKSNTERFKRLAITLGNPPARQYLISTYVQTSNDKNFVLNFYADLNLLVNNIIQIGGIVTCFSFATFCSETNKYCHGFNYNMFKEIKTINFNLLCEWSFNLENYSLIGYKPYLTLHYNDDSIKIKYDANMNLTILCDYINKYKKLKKSNNEEFIEK